MAATVLSAVDIKLVFKLATFCQNQRCEMTVTWRPRDAKGCIAAAAAAVAGRSRCKTIATNEIVDQH